MAGPDLREQARELLHGWESLWAEYEHGRLADTRDLQALAEMCFRIAVHPGTDPATALNLLFRAHRIDGLNPRYSYHIGRVYLAHGRVDEAAEWLVTAARLCPTSHRVWSHLSLVQRAVFERHRGDPKCDADELRQRAERIGTAVKKGEDEISFDLANFKPEANSTSSRSSHGTAGATEEAGEDDNGGAGEDDNGRVFRVTRSGTCRWSGIRDMEVEAGYGLATTEYNLTELILPQLEEVAKLAARRPGGTAAFTVLAVEWLVCGYPVETIRRVAAKLPDADGPARDLLDRTCELFEVDEAELPGQLAACLDRDMLPPVLVAMIHYRRLVWERMRGVYDGGVLDAARRFVADSGSASSDKVAAEHARDLQNMIDFVRKPPPRPLKDAGGPARPAQRSTGEVLDALASLESSTEALARVRDDMLSFVKAISAAVTSAADADTVARVTADHGAMSAAIAGIEQLARTLHASVTSLGEGVGHISKKDLGEDFQDRLKAGKNTLDGMVNLGRPRKALDRVKKALDAVPDELRSSQGEPTDLAGEILREIERVGSGLRGTDPDTAAEVPEQHPPVRPDPAPETVAPNPEGVEAAIGRLVQVVDDGFTRARASLEVYPETARRTGALSALGDFIDGHHAESLYRMGRSADAARIWHGMAARDRLDTAVLRNLAVAHTMRDEAPQAAWAWQSYLETLYFLDIAEGNPRRHAEERARLHETWSAAYGPRSLLRTERKEREGDVDHSDIPEFLGRGSCVAAMAAHKRLEALNRYLAYRSPTLVLGTGYATPKEDLERVRDRQLDFVRGACALLPRRVRAAFGDLAVEHVEAAYAEASDPPRRTRERDGRQDEEAAHVKWLAGLVLMKSRIQNALIEHSGWAIGPSSGEVLKNLALVDAIPLDPTDKLTCNAAQSLGSDNPEETVQRFNALAALACKVALLEIEAGVKTEEAGTFAPRFRQMVESWVRRAVPDEYAAALDDPQLLYGPSVVAAIKVVNRGETSLRSRDRRILDEAVKELKRLVEALPGTTGLARLAANLLAVLGRYEEARELLSRVIGEAFHPGGRQASEELLARLAIKPVTFPRQYPASRPWSSAAPRTMSSGLSLRMYI